MGYIKKYEEFINEAFQSNKLRTIIKQNGYPKYNWDKRILYDTQDSDILGLVRDRDEYKEKYKNSGFRDDEPTFYIELENGKLLVLKNFDTLKDSVESMDKETLKQRLEILKKERRKYNQGILHPKPKNTVYDEQEKRKFLKGFATKENISEITRNVEHYIEENLAEYSDQNDVEFEINMEVSGEKITCYVKLELSSDSYPRRGGYEEVTISGFLEEMSFYFDDKEYEFDDDILYNGKSEFEIKYDAVTDYYTYNGVSIGDFI